MFPFGKNIMNVVWLFHYAKFKQYNIVNVSVDFSELLIYNVIKRQKRKLVHLSRGNFMWKSVSLATKLYLLFALTLVILFGTNLFSSFKLKGVSQEIIDTLYYQTYKSAELILNADRDLYQALLAQRTLLSVDTDSDTFKTQLDVYKENLSQTKSRTSQAKTIFEKNPTIASNMIHPDTKRSILDEFDLFFPQLEKWEAQSNHLIDIMSKHQNLD